MERERVREGMTCSKGSQVGLEPGPAAPRTQPFKHGCDYADMTTNYDKKSRIFQGKYSNSKIFLTLTT